jgi:hypothetical protein
MSFADEKSCSWLMARGRDEDPKGVTSVSAITGPHDTSTSVDTMRGYSTRRDQRLMCRMGRNADGTRWGASGGTIIPSDAWRRSGAVDMITGRASRERASDTCQTHQARAVDPLV